ncbi:MAG: PH domain-containing protein [Clostridium sp.]
MDDRELLKALNGIEFDEEEIEECLNYDGISIDELKYKSSNLVTKSSQEYFEEQKQMVKSLLDKDETMKAYVKGANIEMLRLGSILSGGTFKTNDIGFNYSMFITQKRVFVCDMNYYNSKTSDFKEIPLKDIKDITLNKVGYRAPKEVRKAWGGAIHPTTISNTWLYWLYGAGAIAGIGAIQAMITTLFNHFSLFGGTPGEKVFPIIDFVGKTSLISLCCSLSIVLVFYLIVRHYTKYKLRVSLTTKSYAYFDFIIVNSDHKYILKILKQIKNSIKN